MLLGCDLSCDVGDDGPEAVEMPGVFGELGEGLDVSGDVDLGFASVAGHLA